MSLDQVVNADAEEELASEDEDEIFVVKKNTKNGPVKISWNFRDQKLEN